MPLRTWTPGKAFLLAVGDGAIRAGDRHLIGIDRDAARRAAQQGPAIWAISGSRQAALAKNGRRSTAASKEAILIDLNDGISAAWTQKKVMRRRDAA
ncbi:MAG: hypothetical protein R3F21_21650 [Myxococcota bacterium]